MITVTKLNGKEMTINCELIEMMESNPDTTISMTTGKKLIARESIDEIIQRVIEYKRTIYGSKRPD